MVTFLLKIMILSIAWINKHYLYCDLKAQDEDVGNELNLILVNVNLIKILYTVSRLKKLNWIELILYCSIIPPLKDVFPTTSSGIR